MLASVDNHRGPGVRRQRGIPPASNGGERADKGSRTSFAIVTECGVRKCLSRETGLGGDVFGRIQGGVQLGFTEEFVELFWEDGRKRVAV